MTKRQIVYSPHPATDYIIRDLDDCEVSWILGLPIAFPTWNLFYLSVPEIDRLPGSGADWWKHYKPRVGAMGAVITDVTDDEVLYRKLMMPLARFSEWFERADHQSFRCYHHLGGNAWVDTVNTRASTKARAVGNVVYGTFGPRQIACRA